MKVFIVIAILCFCCKISIAQHKKQSKQSKKNPFEMVHVSDCVTTKLYNFIASTGQSTENAGLYIYHLLGQDKYNNYQFVEGIYSFRLRGPDFLLYYFIYTKKDGIQIIKNYSLEGLLKQVLSFFARNETSFSERNKIRYIEVMIHNLDKRYDVLGNSEDA